MDTVVIIVMCLLFVSLIYFMQQSIPNKKATSEQMVNVTPYDGWFTSGSWKTGWYGPGVDYGIGPPPNCSRELL